MAPAARLLRNFLVVSAGNVAGQLLLLLGLAHLGRVLGPSGFGVWNVAQVWMLYLFRGGEMGLEVVGIRSIASGAGDVSGRAAAGVIVMRIMLAFLLMGGMLAAVALGAVPAGSERLILVFTLAVFPMALITEWVFEAHQAMGVVGIARVLKGALFALPVLLLVRDGSDVYMAAWVYVGSVCAATLFVGFMAQRRYRLWPSAIHWGYSWTMLREGFPIGMANVLTQYSLFVGTILAGYFMTPERVGYYTASHRLIIFLWAYGLTASSRVVLPQLSRLFSESSELFAGFVRKYFRLICVVSVPIAIVGVAGGPEIVRIIYRSRYDEGIPVFQVLSVALVIAVVRSILELGLIAGHRQSSYMKGVFGQAVLYTVATVIALRFGTIADVAWAAVLSELCYAIYLAVVFRSVRVREMFALSVRPVLAGSGILALLFAAGLRSLPVVILAGTVLYFGVLYVFGGVSRDDLTMCLGLIGARRTIPSS